VTRVVVDASVAVKWFLPEELSEEARQVLTPKYQLLAPDLLWAELGNVLWKRHRRREVDQRTATRLLQDLSRVPIEYHASQQWATPALELAIRHDLTVYDGLYLALAAGNQCRLVTADRRLHDVSRSDALGQIVSWVRDLR
jgi:predicted nucleic acid-binding protein